MFLLLLYHFKDWVLQSCSDIQIFLKLLFFFFQLLELFTPLCPLGLCNFMEPNTSEKLPIMQHLKNFPAYYGTWRFITMFTRALHWSLSWARSIQPIPLYHISLRSVLTLSSHLCLCLPSGPFFAFLSISYMHSSSPLFMLHVLPILSSLTSSL
jgi:hypothetical protein